MPSSWQQQGYFPSQQPTAPRRAAAPARPAPDPRPASPAQDPRPASPAPAPAINVNVYAHAPESFYDGGVLSALGLGIGNFLIIVCTLGLCYPWAACRSYRYVQQHTVIDGHRLVFDGTAVSLFGVWIKIWFLCIITLGIYAFWGGNAVRRWVVRHTHLS